MQRGDLQRVMDRIRGLAGDPRPPGCEKLAGMANAWRIRSGNYRVVLHGRRPCPGGDDHPGRPPTRGLQEEMSTMLVTVTEAKARLGELIREATEEDVVVVRHGHPAAVLVGAERYDALLEELEDLKDRLSVYESAQSEPGLRVGFEKMAAELGVR